MRVRELRVVLVALVAAIWIALGRLTFAFWNSELDWVTVASYSRRDAPWYYRLAAVWGGLDGSLLLFVAILGGCAVLAVGHLRTVVAHVYAIGVVAATASISLALANPFRTLDVPATGGFGLTPILEHPAMAVHPPVLYMGLAATLVVFLFGLDGQAATSDRWLRWSLALITVAMALGALWSYVEQGWGGYWAWDPVENTSLLVWLAVLMAIHTRRAWADGRRRWTAIRSLPWLLTLFGACVVRSGSTPSIHGFGQRAAMGWWLLALTLATVGVAWWTVVVRDRRERSFDVATGDAIEGISGPPRRPLGDTAMSVWVTSIIGAVVLAGTLAPVVIDLVADRPAAVRGRFYAAFVGPAALIGAVFAARRLRRVSARGWVAHLGVLVLLVGVGASTFDRTATVRIGAGQTVEAAGVTITNVALRVEPGPRIESDAVVATVTVDGATLEPRRVAFRDRGGQLAENAVITRPWRDVQVQLDSANDAGVLTLTIYNRPLMWLVWIGAVLVAIGAWRTPLRRRAGDDGGDAPGDGRGQPGPGVVISSEPTNAAASSALSLPMST